MCACVRVCVCSTATISFFYFEMSIQPPLLVRFLSSFPSAILSTSLSLALSLFPPLSLSFSFSLSLSLSPSLSSHSLCVARVMSARNLPRKLAYKNVDGKYLRSSSSSTAAAKATITATTVEYRQQQQRSSSSSIPRFSIRFTNLGDWLCHLLAVN